MFASASARNPAWFRPFKAVVYALLLANVGVFMWAADDVLAPKAIDQIGWVIILAVFEWETSRLTRGRALTTVSPGALLAELTGYACALYALRYYVAIADPVEIANASAWLAISALIWFDLFNPEGARNFGRSALRWLLYAVTFACAVIWGVGGVWLDFADAVIWIICFFVIEINIFGFDIPSLRR
ncbi:hypothetical protein [Sandarakinorhabdus oryzae]|uniref:hypothetical protein n=1 Tax=Sandarakinorhabdus oryzae TaxID=2675220 RepID=UPI0012E170B3|nr:hypothetical protein [Sandarakinorhabdus oryzae]